MTKNRKIAYLAATATALIWGAAFPIVKPALEYVTPQQFLYLRFLIAVPLLLPFLIRAIHKKHIKLNHLLPIIVLELLSMTVLFIIYIGLEQTHSLQAAFITNTKPIFITLAGIIFLKEVEEQHEIVGLIMSVIGTTLIIASPVIFSHQLEVSGSSSLFGNGLILLAVFLDVIRLINVKKHYKEINKFVIVSFSSIIGLIYYGIIGLFSNTIPPVSTLLNPSVALAAIYMGTLGTVLAFTFQFIAYARIEASEASLFEYLQPLVYIPLAVFWLGEKLLPTQLVGIIIIAIGVYLAEKRSRVKHRQKISVPHRPHLSLQHHKG